MNKKKTNRQTGKQQYTIKQHRKIKNEENEPHYELVVISASPEQ